MTAVVSDNNLLHHNLVGWNSSGNRGLELWAASMSTIPGLTTLSSHRPVCHARRSSVAGLHSTHSLAVSTVGNTTANEALLSSRQSKFLRSSFSSSLSSPGQICTRPRVAKAFAYARGPQNNFNPLQNVSYGAGSQGKMTPAGVRLLSKGELQQELEMRSLSTAGLKADLRKRLIDAINEQQLGMICPVCPE